MSYARRAALLKAADAVVVGLIVLLALACGLGRAGGLFDAAQLPAALGMAADAVLALALLGVVAIGILAWRIFGRIGRDDAFCEQNAVELNGVAIVACLLCVLALASGIVLFACTSMPPFSLLLAALGCFVFAIVANALAHLTRKAAAIQSENDLTV